MVWALPLDEFPLGIKTFAAETVTSLVFAEKNVAGIVYFLQDLLDNPSFVHYVLSVLRY